MEFQSQNNSKLLLGMGVLAGITIASLAVAVGYQVGVRSALVDDVAAGAVVEIETINEAVVLPPDGVVLPARWGNLGTRLVATGVIDREKFEAIYESRGGLSEDDIRLLESETNGQLVITSENSGYLLNLLWALGLANSNDILDEGPMQDERYGGPGGFASTGGWSLAVGESMDHYSSHDLVPLTPEQQELVERVSQGIYRPCCGNSTYFPDCNHGMAMLGLLELMASQGVSESDMYRFALQVNAYWFPDTYLTIAKYLRENDQSWEAADPALLLGYDYSSGTGYREILAEVEPVKGSSGGGCGV